jgi:queuine tRNA-ribosyltransferase
LKFKLEAQDQKASAGHITTAHGSIETPIFMPVGTLGTVKGVHQHELKEDTKAQIILGNTYHLFMRPGTGILEQAGGLHRLLVGIDPYLQTAEAIKCIRWPTAEK